MYQNERASPGVPRNWSIPWEGAELGQITLSAMRLVRAMGDTFMVGLYLCDPVLFAHGVLDPYAQDEIDEARTWFAAAKEHEREHGSGSAANRSHPFWAEFERIDRLRGRISDVPLTARAASGSSPH